MPAAHRSRPGAASIVGRAVAVLAAAVSAVALLVPTLALPASAHARIATVEPADGARLAEAPEAVVLTFTAPVLPISPVVVVEPAAGGANLAEEPMVAGETVTAPLDGPLAGGDYVVRWRVVAEDGHAVEGAAGFAVTSGAVAGPATASPSPTATIAPRAGPDAASESPEEEGAGSAFPLPVLLAAAAVLLVAGAGVLARRRRGTAAPGARTG